MQVLYKLVVAIKASGETSDLKEVERLRDVAHYLGMHAMCKAKVRLESRGIYVYI